MTQAVNRRQFVLGALSVAALAAAPRVYAQVGSLAWRAEVDALATRKFAAPGTVKGPGTFTITKPLVIDGFRFQAPNTKIQRCLDLYQSGSLTLRNFEILGSFGRAEDKIALITRITLPNKAGKLLLLEDGTIAGHSADWLKIAGVAGAEQTIRRVYFGPQWATIGSTTHADMITFIALLGDILIEKCRFDRTKDGRPAGLNNLLRIVPNNGTDPVGKGTIRVRQSVVYGDQLNSALIQMVHKTNYRPTLDLDEVCLPVSRIGMGKVFHPSTPLGSVIWRRVYDTYTGALIPAPAGCRTS
jgi:hypothetical protein